VVPDVAHEMLAVDEDKLVYQLLNQSWTHKLSKT
jgi:hypothetical protein